jgi:hypothetical protein
MGNSILPLFQRLADSDGLPLVKKERRPMWLRTSCLAPLPQTTRADAAGRSAAVVWFKTIVVVASLIDANQLWIWSVACARDRTVTA